MSGHLPEKLARQQSRAVRACIPRGPAPHRTESAELFEKRKQLVKNFKKDDKVRTPQGDGVVRVVNLQRGTLIVRIGRKEPTFTADAVTKL